MTHTRAKAASAPLRGGRPRAWASVPMTESARLGHRPPQETSGADAQFSSATVFSPVTIRWTRLPLELRAEYPPTVRLPPMFAHGASTASYVPRGEQPKREVLQSSARIAFQEPNDKARNEVV